MDHVGTVIPQDHGGQRPGDILPEIDDAQTGKSSFLLHGITSSLNCNIIENILIQKLNIVKQWRDGWEHNHLVVRLPGTP